MGLELATPALSAYAGRKPLQFLGIAAAAGAVVVIARPWRLISVTGLLVAIAKSSQLSTVLMSALSAADYQRDRRTARMNASRTARCGCPGSFWEASAPKSPINSRRKP